MHLCNYHQDQNIKLLNISGITDGPKRPRLVSNNILHPTENQYSNLYIQKLMLSILEFHINGIIKYLSFVSGFLM